MGRKANKPVAQIGGNEVPFIGNLRCYADGNSRRCTGPFEPKNGPAVSMYIKFKVA
jgi:hypothetical protein